MLDPESKQAILDRLTAISTFKSLNIRIDELSEGRAVATLPRDGRFDGVFESLHGGIMMTLADSVTCAALLTLVGADTIVTTTDMNIRFFAPCLTDVTVDCSVIRSGRTLSLTEARLTDANSKLVALAQVNYMRLDKMPRRAN